MCSDVTSGSLWPPQGHPSCPSMDRCRPAGAWTTDGQILTDRATVTCRGPRGRPTPRNGMRMPVCHELRRAPGHALGAQRLCTWLRPPAPRHGVSVATAAGATHCHGPQPHGAALPLPDHGEARRCAACRPSCCVILVGDAGPDPGRQAALRGPSTPPRQQPQRCRYDDRCAHACLLAASPAALVPQDPETLAPGTRRAPARLNCERTNIAALTAAVRDAATGPGPKGQERCRQPLTPVPATSGQDGPVDYGLQSG